MNVVFYSTSSGRFDFTKVHHKNLPPCKKQLENLTAAYPGWNFSVVTAFPGLFLLDIDSEGSFSRADGVEYIILNNESAEETAEIIASLKPDCAVAVTFWITPFDWLGVKDALVAEKLREKGIRALCSPAEFELDCFDKRRTHLLLEKLGIRTPKSVYVHHELFWAERAKPDVNGNCYKEYVFDRIQKLHYPCVIKDTAGLSSYGAEVVKTFAQAKSFLLSKKNSGDRIVEEYISGLQFGAELYGHDGAYTVFPPFMFSVNQYGITSPKQSVKLGPVSAPRFRTDRLTSLLLRIAQECSICGSAQFDLVFAPDTEEWYVLEINPRLSGMSRTVACAYGTTPLEMLLRPEKTAPAEKLVMSCKFPPLDEAEFLRLKNTPGVLHVSQTVNDAARQRRECGFCEVIFGGRTKAQELLSDLHRLRAAFPNSAEPAFFDTAEKMLSLLY